MKVLNTSITIALENYETGERAGTLELTREITETRTYFHATMWLGSGGSYTARRDTAEEAVQAAADMAPHGIAVRTQADWSFLMSMFNVEERLRNAAEFTPKRKCEAAPNKE